MKKALALLVLVPALLEAQEDEKLGWPRLLEADGVTIVAYQPQIETWDDHKKLELQMALEFTPVGKQESSVAAMRIRARTKVDFSERTVEISNAKIASVDFPNVDAATASRYRKLIKERLDGRTWTNSLDRMVANVERTGQKPREVKVSTQAPPIYYSEKDAILIQYMGQPAFEPVPGTKLKFAANTNWDIFQIDAGPQAYMLVDDGWVKSNNAVGTQWEPAGELPPEFQLLPNDRNWGDVRKNVPGKPIQDMPAIFVSLRPAEMILVDGERKLGKIDGTGLQYVMNCDEDLFYLESKKRWYFLVAGRWFETSQLKNLASWQPVRDLPADFAKIPEDHEMAEVRAMVPDTPESEEAVMQASIPRTASVKREGTTLEVTYDGEPQFEAIEGTAGVEYAVNSPFDVFRFNNQYYCCDNGVWFVATTPNGPWVLCEKVPDEIYNIPGDHPKHNCTYVYVYDTDDDEIVYGYTGGYYGLYFWRRRIWFGYGYWWGFRHGLRWRRWYKWTHRPVHYAYGMGARYSAYRASFLRGANGYGPYGGVGRGAVYNPKAKGWVRGEAAYGKRDGRLSSSAYTPAARSYARSGKASSIYGTWGKRATARDDQWAATSAKKQQARTAAKAAQAGLKPAAGRNNNVFVGRDNLVYRRNNNGWQVKGKKGWENFDPNRKPAVKPETRPNQKKPQVNRQQVHRDLNRQYSHRNRGNYRTKQYNYRRTTRTYTRRSSGYRRSAGGRRGGGGRGGGRR
ncbi:MAG: hypothetical protein ACYTHK_09030 [Planctomycetota bacterium]|jgi:hypothetical protein